MGTLTFLLEYKNSLLTLNPHCKTFLQLHTIKHYVLFYTILNTYYILIDSRYKTHARDIAKLLDMKT